jgi:hypothetical protein
LSFFERAAETGAVIGIGKPAVAVAVASVVVVVVIVDADRGIRCIFSLTIPMA